MLEAGEVLLPSCLNITNYEWLLHSQLLYGDVNIHKQSVKSINIRNSWESRPLP